MTDLFVDDLLGSTLVNSLAARAFLLRATSGDAQAEREIIEALTPIIRASVGRTMRRNTCRALTADVDDVTQSVLLALFAKSESALTRWDPDRGMGFRGFVSMLAAHETVGILRSRKRGSRAEVPTRCEALDQNPTAWVEPEAAASARSTVMAVVERVRARVSDRGGQVFDLLFLEQHTPEDIAAATGLGLTAIYNWSSRLSRLGREVAAELESEVFGAALQDPCSFTSASRKARSMVPVSARP